MLIAYEEPGTEVLRVPVLKVFDGDGFLSRLRNPWRFLDRELSVRFGFTDAPELRQPGGQEARAFLNSLIGGRWVELVVLLKMDTGGIMDRHGRIVCVPYLRESRFGPARNIELEMVLNGWTWVLDRYGPDARYYDALDHAKKYRRGIWAFDDNVHPWDFKRQHYPRPHGRPQVHSKAATEGNCPRACGGHLIKRNGKYGAFWGCSNFPTCRYSSSI